MLIFTSSITHSIISSKGVNNKIDRFFSFGDNIIEVLAPFYFKKALLLFDSACHFIYHKIQGSTIEMTYLIPRNTRIFTTGILGIEEIHIKGELALSHRTKIDIMFFWKKIEDGYQFGGRHL